VTILHTRPGQSSIDGVGAVHVRNQASATITGATIADNEEGGVHVIGSGTSATLANIVLRDNDTGPSSIGDGILVDEGGYLALDRASMTGSQQHGVFVNGADSELAATDLRIAQTRASDSGERGWALRAQDGARVRVQRASFEDSNELGVFARGGSTNVTLEDTAVVRTAAAADGTDGFGIVAFDGAELSLERGSVTESHDVGILASDSGTSVSLLDVRVSSTAASPDGTRGFGAAAQDGASLSMGRVEVSESSDVGVLVADATATLVDVRVTGVVERPCLSRGDCPGSATWRSGMGVVTVNGSQLSATSLHVESAAACGMLVSASPVGGEGASDMSLELALSGVYRNAVGLCLQVSGIDPGPGLHLDSTNGVPLDRSSFPPATAVPFL
jgi:hypothetical protein